MVGPKSTSPKSTAVGRLSSLVGWVAFAAVAIYLFVENAMQPCRTFTLGAGDVVKGKVIVVTGANSGLGYFTAKFLAQRGARVIMGCRSAARCEAAATTIVTESKGQHPDLVVPETMVLDLISQASVRQFAAALKEKAPEIDVLVNNAGVMALAPPRTLSPEGIEAQFAINHVGHFLLTALVYPLLKQGGRIVNHSSGAHMAAPADFFVAGDYQTSKYDSATTWSAYGQSKAANLQFTYELNDRLAAAGNPKNIVSIAVHPGYTDTGLQEKSTMRTWFDAHVWANKLAMTLADGSISQIMAAVSTSVNASKNTFFGPRFGMFGFPVESETGKYHKASQLRLWAISEELTQSSFPL